MSHVVRIKTELRDLAAIQAACNRLGWTLNEGATTYKWWGRYMGDSPLPEGFTAEDLGKCTHSITVAGATYQIGLVKQNTGFLPLWDYWSSGGLKKSTGETLAQAYAIEKAKIEARKQGHSVTEKALADGSVELTITTG